MSNVLFMSLGRFGTLDEPGIYTDLLRCFLAHGHAVHALSSKEEGGGVEVTRSGSATIARVPTGRIQKTNVVQKGVNTLLIGPRYKKAIRDVFRGTRFDLVLYPTPPITLGGAVSFVKRRDGAAAYLLLKDIFPQNAVDMGMMREGGAAHRFFRGKERRLYLLSDKIGCMSEANARYLLEHNGGIGEGDVEVCPNSLQPVDRRVPGGQKPEIRSRYGLPEGKRLFVYGGNIGRPQGIPSMVECLRACEGVPDAHFLIVGDGTERASLEKLVAGMENVTVMRALPREEYDRLVGACDVGLIFLDPRFTIPNFPSRLLAYLQAGVPVIACTDRATDVGSAAVGGEYGWSCHSDDPAAFSALVRTACGADLDAMGERAFDALLRDYSVEAAYQTIKRSVNLDD